MKVKEFYESYIEITESLYEEAIKEVLTYSKDESQEGQWRKSTAQSAMVWLEMKLKELKNLKD